MLTKREQVIPDEEAGDDAGVDDADADFEEDAPAPATKKARPSEHDASAEVAPKAKISMQPNSAIKLDVPADQQDAVVRFSFGFPLADHSNKTIDGWCVGTPGLWLLFWLIAFSFSCKLSLTASTHRRAWVSSFRGQKLVNIREFYLDKDSGVFKFSKKGLALTPDQFRALVAAAPDLEQGLSA
eukprot:TRINITY_DN1783_c0_g1_i1.p1 TRINITY_DN1783_c0_g1~~TRINITY_DN1783_c0_g1_i1.p1  ORF type:complete len:200 (-),score=51.39 TRINITY_DN1783_c0_g1_i1:12-563(-)